MIYRTILPEWAQKEYPQLPKVMEGEFNNEKLEELNKQFYNIYFLPNYPSEFIPGTPVSGHQIDTFRYVFVDMDLKEEKYKTKEEFLNKLHKISLIPTLIVDSGNGIHAYWEVSDLTPITYLKLQRRLMRQLDTDEAVCKIYQLMRVPGSINTKDPSNLKKCEVLESNNVLYTSEQLNSQLALLLPEDETYCIQHYDKTYNLNNQKLEFTDELPLKFSKLVRDNAEIKKLWGNVSDDRSKSDFRLGHLLFANGLTKEETLSVLVNVPKALSRTPTHRYNYAKNIIDKIWAFEQVQEVKSLTLSSTVKEILQKSGDNIKGTRFPCYTYIDATYHGFRLGQVIGLVAGVGVGKTAIALNMFQGFVKNNPDYEHFFIPLEQPANEIADRWKTMCGENTQLHEKVHILSNYNEDGSFRNLSLDEIQDYILQYQKQTGKKVGCVCIDHIGVLKKQTKNGENQGLMDICHSMKAFAINTNTMLIMQSQAPREKAGIGDLELNKDAAYGTVFFEAYCDYMITMWQPLKRCYSEEGCPTVTAFKFCKIRHKKLGQDSIYEDVPYKLFFDPKTELLRELTEIEEKSFVFFNNKATNKRKQDRKTDILEYKSIDWTKNDSENTNTAR